jgi:hypothetical protein
MITNLDAVLDRDLVLLHKGASMPVKISTSLIQTGWAGGEFARWVDDGSGRLCVDRADGRFCGFFAFGSSESGDQYTALTNQNTRYGFAVLFFDNTILATRTFERYGYMARHALGPMTPLTYAAQKPLYVSENGKFTLEDESSADYPAHTFPDGSPIVVPFNSVGIVILPPTSATKGYLYAHTNGV